MNQRQLPNPSESAHWRDWALRLLQVLEARAAVNEPNLPRPVLLNHYTDDVTHRPSPDGVLMYNPQTQKVIVSVDFEWSPIAGDAEVAWDAITDKPDDFLPSNHTHGWGQITNKPSLFPPARHTHDFSDIYGVVPSHTHYMADIVDFAGVTERRFNIITGQIQAQLDAHIADLANPHETSFLNLTDSDDSDYTGKGGYRVVVNATPDGLVLEANELLTLDDVTDSDLTGKAGQALIVNPGETGFLLDAVAGGIDVDDGSTTVSGATAVEFTSGATVTDGGSGLAQVAISGGSGSAEAFHAYGFDGVGVQVYTTEDFSNTDYDTSTGIYTAPSDGVYYFYGGFVDSGGGSAGTAYLRKNGTRVLRNRRFGLTSVANVPGHIGMLMDLTAGDEVSFETDVATANPGAGVDWNYFGGFRIGD